MCISRLFFNLKKLYTSDMIVDLKRLRSSILEQNARRDGFSQNKIISQDYTPWILQQLTSSQGALSLNRAYIFFPFGAMTYTKIWLI